MNNHLRLIALLLLACPLLAWAADQPGQDVYVSTKNTTLLLLAKTGETPRVAYYGARLNERQGSEVWQTQGSRNQAAYETFNGSTGGFTALNVQHANGQIALDLLVQAVKRTKTDGGELVTIETKDKVMPFYVNLCYRTYEASDVIEAWTEIRHQEKKDVMLTKYASAQLPVTGPDIWVSSFYGGWGSEASLDETHLTKAGFTVTAHDGVRNAHEAHAELMISLDGKQRENEGRTIGAALCWSGNYRMALASWPTNPDNHTLMAGIDDEFPYYLKPGVTFRTPEMAFSYSAEGRGGVSRNMHHWARHHKVHNGTAPRDVLLNSWEGVYLAVNEEKMKTLMKGVADIGGELFVMDDGWFASEKYNRNVDNAALGDWQVDRQKLPNGLKPLTDEAKSDGIKFGIWIEPEMGNWKASDLYDKHPDWFLQNTGREPRLGRGGTQAVLDLCNPKVQDFIFGIVDRLMTDNPEIAYIKWDANCNIANYGSTYLPADRQSQIYVDYHMGLRKVLERVRAKYPDLVMQACGAGGGRTNYGVMPYFDEFWTSDNTDALQRVYIQWGTSYFYPSCTMACHVSASPNHQTGRVIPLKYRFDVAMSGRLGIEMKPSDFNDKELAFAKKAVADYKRLRPVIQQGDLYRIESPFDHQRNLASWMMVAPDKGKAVLYAYKVRNMIGQDTPRIYLHGLNPDRNYKIEEVNKTDDGMKHLSGLVVSGKVLMESGLKMNLGGEYASRVFELTAE